MPNELLKSFNDLVLLARDWGPYLGRTRRLRRKSKRLPIECTDSHVQLFMAGTKDPQPTSSSGIQTSAICATPPDGGTGNGSPLEVVSTGQAACFRLCRMNELRPEWADLMPLQTCKIKLSGLKTRSLGEAKLGKPHVLGLSSGEGRPT